jgi:hypothetical protein
MIYFAPSLGLRDLLRVSTDLLPEFLHLPGTGQCEKGALLFMPSLELWVAG